MTVESPVIPPEAMAAAEEQAAKDREVFAAVEAARAQAAARAKAANGGVSVDETLDTLSKLILDRIAPRRNARLTEQSLVKLLELSIVWTLNNRNTQMPDLPAQEIGGEIEESSPADEALGFDTDESEETAE